MRVSRCLPRASVSTTVRPERSRVAYAGTLKSLETSTDPESAWSRCRAVRQTVSPSGTEPEPPRCRDETGCLEGVPQAAGPLAEAEDVLPVGAFHGQPAERALSHGASERLGRRGQHVGVVAEGQQGAAATFDVHGQLAVDEDHEGPGLAPGTVGGAGCSAVAVHPVGRAT